MSRKNNMSGGKSNGTHEVQLLGTWAIWLYAAALPASRLWAYVVVVPESPDVRKTVVMQLLLLTSVWRSGAWNKRSSSGWATTYTDPPTQLNTAADAPVANESSRRTNVDRMSGLVG